MAARSPRTLPRRTPPPWPHPRARGRASSAPTFIKTYLTDEHRAAGKEDYFDKVGTTFYEAQENVFGDVSNYYAVDPFHEGGTIPEGFDIVDIYRTVQEKMLEHDEDAVWVMQQWQNGINTQKLSGLANKDQALVLDLQSDLRSQASPMEEVGVPWTWDMLHNFGGRMGMDGVPEVIATEVTEAYNNSEHMVGIGITPEAINNSPIVYELLFDMTWEQDPIDYREWTSNYIERRYGGTDEKIQEAWDILLETAYAHKDDEYYQGASESIINARPSDGQIGSASTWGHSDIDYDKERFEEAARLFVECYDTYKDSEAFRYDFVDVMRQVLQNAFQEYQPLAGEAYKANDLEALPHALSQMLEIVKLQDELLSSSDYFLVGTWIENARTMLEDEDDWTQDLFEAQRPRPHHHVGPAEEQLARGLLQPPVGGPHGRVLLRALGDLRSEQARKARGRHVLLGPQLVYVRMGVGQQKERRGLWLCH